MLKLGIFFFGGLKLARRRRFPGHCSAFAGGGEDECDMKVLGNKIPTIKTTSRWSFIYTDHLIAESHCTTRGASGSSTNAAEQATRLTRKGGRVGDVREAGLAANNCCLCKEDKTR